MRSTLLIVLAAVVAAALVLPWDGVISHWAVAVHLGGDVRRTFETLQQYGDLGTLVLTGLIIWLLDPTRRRRLWDLALASGLTGLACLVLKILVGRPRPALAEPWGFLGPIERFPMPDGQGGQNWLHTWNLGVRGVSDLWSMPSSHTAAAMALSLFLVSIYPRLRPLAVAMVVIVGLGRLLTGAHYPSDLLAGAAVALLIAGPVVRGRWGVRVTGGRG